MTVAKMALLELVEQEADADRRLAYPPTAAGPTASGQYRGWIHCDSPEC